MAKNTGYIKVSRDILHSDVWESDERFDLRSIFIDLTIRANHSEQKKIQGNHSYTLKRGQLTGSLRQFGEWWNLDKDTAKKKLMLLQELGLIYYDSQTLPQTLITLVNYCSEQSKNGLCADSTSDTVSDETSDSMSDSTSDETSDYYKNDKECNKNVKRMNKKEPTAQRGDF